jgi:hypothetical protein
MRGIRGVHSCNDKRCNTMRTRTWVIRERYTLGERFVNEGRLSKLFLRRTCSEIFKTYLRTVCRVVSEEDCCHPFTTVVRVIQSAAPHAVVCASISNASKASPALVTRPKRPTLKSRSEAFSEFCVHATRQ